MIPAIGALKALPYMDPSHGAPPYAITLPSEATCQYSPYQYKDRPTIDWLELDWQLGLSAASGVGVGPKP